MPHKNDKCNGSIRGSIHVMPLQNKQKNDIPDNYACVILEVDQLLDAPQFAST